MTELPLPLKELELALTLQQRMHADTDATLNTLIESYKRDLAEARATLELVRTRVDRLVSGTYMPTPNAIIAELYPQREKVEALRNELLEEL